MAGCPICEDLNHGVAGCPHSLVGTTLGKYQVEAFLAAGGMGVVYTGVHQSLGSPVAIKTLHRALLPQNARTDARRQLAETLVKRFTEEARRAASLRHPSIVRVEDLGVAPDGTPYLAMELLEGLSLKELLEKDGPLPPERAAELTAQALDALEFAHQRNIIHRDIKPENLFLQHPGEAAESIKVLDFGIAKALGNGATQLGLTHSGHGAMGTFYYMSPEQAQDPRQVTASSDVFSVGASLFELLTGHTVLHRIEGELLTSGIMAVLRAIIDGRIERHPRGLRGEIPGWLDAVVARSLAFDPAERFATASDMAGALRAGASGQREAPAPKPMALASTAPSMPPGAPLPRTEVAPARSGPVAALGSTTAESAGERVLPVPLSPVARRSKAPWIAAASLAAVAAAVAAAVVVGGGDAGTQAAASTAAPDAAALTAAAADAAPTPSLAAAAPLDAAPPSRDAGAEAEKAPAPAVHASKPHGFLAINSRPSCKIAIDGHATGKSTPQRRLRLVAGKHRVTLVGASKAIHESFTVQIRAGETTRVVKRLSGGEVSKGEVSKCDEASCRVNPAQACCPKKTASPQVNGAVSGAEVPPKGPRLTARDVKAGIARVQGRVMVCGRKTSFRGRVMVKLRIGEGRVTSAKATPIPSSPATASCVEAALKAARFPRAPSMTVSYPFILR